VAGRREKEDYVPDQTEDQELGIHASARLVGSGGLRNPFRGRESQRKIHFVVVRDTAFWDS
jgi:hypothetical protein